MTYVAKYFPVDDEIKIGDLYMYRNSIPVKRLEKETIPGTEDYKKAKLFLCSREISIGDKDIWFIHASGEMEHIKEVKYEHQFDFMKELLKVGKDLLKVIGPISPYAGWVKEGDEFEFKDLDLIHPGDRHMHVGFSGDRIHEINAPHYVSIKGPCGNFH